MVAALLHDIGKGGLTEHSVAGEPLAREIAARMGFDAGGGRPGRHRWSAGTCCSPRPRPPATPTTRRPSARGRSAGRAAAEALTLLAALTEADARATSPKAWSSWRAGLIRDLGRRVPAELDPGSAAGRSPSEDVEIPPAVARRRRRRSRSSRGDDGATVTVDRAGPGRAARRRGRGVRAAADVGAGRPGLVAGRRTASRCGRSPTSSSTRRCCGSGSRRSPRAGSTRPSGCGRRRRTTLAPTVVVRPEASVAGHRARGAGHRPARASSTSSARRSPSSTSRSAPPTSTPSARRRWTCSTCRRRRPGALSRPRGRPTPPTPSRAALDAARRLGLDACGTGYAGPDRRLRTSEGPPLVRHTLRPPRRHLQEPAGQGPALRGRHRRHRARDPDRAARGRRRAAGGQGVRRRGQGAGPRRGGQRGAEPRPADRQDRQRGAGRRSSAARPAGCATPSPARP